MLQTGKSDESQMTEIPMATEQIEPYLNEIAERLWSGHAAVMVGAGFSWNAKPNFPSQKKFPDWPQLGDIFYEKIHGNQSASNNRYLSVLKLADEVQAAFGRPALDQLLRSSIPDEDYKPSPLHIKLLQLPWTDVFTTNYDTLLERACANVESQKFDIVVNKEDLVYSEQPRIIKLHGSFPSERPFIITEEDYRKYPRDFAPFVNTVQQSLLENTLCLIGFSGNDPNFLQWTGWIRDNLGRDNSPKIFLIGIFDLSDAQKKLIEQRNIILVDMSMWPRFSGDHATALNVFLDYVLSKKKGDRQLRWPSNQQFMFLRHEQDSTKQLTDVVTEWKANRRNYPDWVILPEDRRSSLWVYTEAWTNIKPYLKKLEIPSDIDFIYELNWRLEKCLCPIFNSNIELYTSVINKYNPFPDMLTIETASITENNDQHRGLDWKQIKEEWLELNISMMRFYREEGCLDEWELMNERMQQLYSVLPPELRARLHYERCLSSLFTLKLSNVEEQLKSWPLNDTLPFWEAKRAGLMAELGNIDEAEKILEKSLSFIRTRLNLSPVSLDYSWVSKEAFTMLLLQYIKNAAIYRQREFKKLAEVRERFSERWNALKRYKCDPWGELKLFESRLKKEPVYTDATTEEHEFDIGIVRSTHHFASTDTEALNAYSFLRYFEEAGIPFRVPGTQIGTKLALGAVKRIRNYSPYWAFAAFVRAGDSKSADIISGRETISKTPVKQIDRFIEDYLGVLKGASAETEHEFHKGNFGTVLTAVIPEILSRLCTKCSISLKDNLLSFAKELYSSDQKHKYEGVANLIRRLLSSYSVTEQYSRLPVLLDFPIPNDLNLITKDEYPEPSYFLTVNQDSMGLLNNLQLDWAAISKLLHKARSEDSSERIRAIRRVAQLHELNLLDEEYTKQFSEVLWSQTDDLTGFPKNTDCYNFTFLKFLPHPDNVDPVFLFKAYIAEERLPIQKVKTEKGITSTNGDIPFCKELIGATRGPLSDKGIDWSEKEATDLFYRLLEWWDSDKEFTKKDRDTEFLSVGDEFRKRFDKLARILTQVVIPRLSHETSTREELERLLNELSEYGIKCLATRTASLCIYPEQKQFILNEIKAAILSKEKDEIKEGYNAIYQILVLHKSGKITEIPIDMFSYIELPIRWRRLTNLIYSMRTGINILNNFPETITEDLLCGMVLGLDALIDETRLEDELSSTETVERMDVRAVAMSLSYTLYKYYKTKDLPIPETLQKWHAVSTDVEEFADVRNKWIISDL